MEMPEEKNIIETIRKYYPDVTAIYLFGSYSSKENVESSDIDIALLLPHENSKESKNIELQLELEAKFSKDVDLIFLRSSNTVLQKEVIMADSLIFCADRNTVDEFEMLVMSKYQKLNEERKDIIKDALKTGVFL